MKKILFIVNTDWFFISHRLPIALSMLKKGFEIHVACNYSFEKDKMQKFGFITHSINIDRKSLNIFDSISNSLEILKLIRDVKPNIVHLITIKPIILGGLVLNFFRKKPYVVFSVSGLGHIFISKGFISILKRSLIKFLYKLAFIHKNIVVIFQNKDDLKLISKITNLDKSKSILIPGSGVILKNYPYSPLPSEKVVLFPARLLKSKGIYEFVECAKILKGQARFVISGQLDEGNPDCIDIEIFNDWLKSCIFEYWGFSKNMSYTFSKCSIVVLPSYREGFPKVLMEAAASGRPIITTDVPGCRDAILPNKTGLLVKAKDHLDLVRAVKKMISDEFDLGKMSKASRQFALERFSVTKVIKAHQEIYSRFS